MDNDNCLEKFIMWLKAPYFENLIKVFHSNMKITSFDNFNNKSHTQIG